MNSVVALQSIAIKSRVIFKDTAFVDEALLVSRDVRCLSDQGFESRDGGGEVDMEGEFATVSAADMDEGIRVRGEGRGVLLRHGYGVEKTRSHNGWR